MYIFLGVVFIRNFIPCISPGSTLFAKDHFYLLPVNKSEYI